MKNSKYKSYFELKISSEMHYDLALQYTQMLLQGDRHSAGKLIFDAVKSGVPIKEIYLYVFQPSQYEIGRLWQNNKISVAKEHFCTASTQFIISQLYP